VHQVARPRQDLRLPQRPHHLAATDRAGADEEAPSEGKTDLLTGFVSARTRRKFSAYLVRQPDGKIGFEFEPREASEKKGRSATRKKAKAAETS